MTLTVVATRHVNEYVIMICPDNRISHVFGSSNVDQ